MAALTAPSANSIRKQIGFFTKPVQMSLGLRLQAATSEYQKLETDLSNTVEARQKLDAQLSENEQVKKVLVFCCQTIFAIALFFQIMTLSS